MVPAADLVSHSVGLGFQYRSDAPLRTLFLLYRQDWQKLAQSFSFFVIKHSPEWIRPLIIANIIDILTQPEEYQLSALWLNGTVLVISVIQNLPMHYLHIGAMSAAVRQMELNLRSAITLRLQQLSINYHNRRSTGTIQAKLLQDVDRIQQLTRDVFQFIPAALLTIAIAIGVTARRAPWFLLFFVATVPAAVLIVRLLRGPMRDRNYAFRRQVETMSAHLSEMIKLIPVTRAHGAESTAIQRTQTTLDSVKQAGLRLDSINAITNASTWITLRLFNATCLIMAAYLAYTGQLNISPGDVVLLTGYFDTLTQSTAQILAVLPQMTTGLEAIRSVGEILECPDLEFNQGKQPVEEVTGSVHFEAVSFTYPDQMRPALHGIDLAVEAGETIALVGPSGAGKSTLVSLVIGFLRPTHGQILLDGKDMNLLDLRTYRQFVSVVAQETILFEGTVRDNILYGVESVDEARLRQAIRDAYAEEFITQLPAGLNTLIGENGARLSGGQRQRLAIARALIRNPRVLILDEATASLDTASESMIQAALTTLMQGRTTFVVAHRLSTIRQADRIVVLDQGHIVEVGNHRQLLRQQGLYAELHTLQVL
ncbi:MAG: ABC transporter ATP-binding protein [Cyanobacteria bacterium P01_A01_bin.123]